MIDTPSYSVSRPQRFEVGGRTYFFIPSSGSLVEADTESLALLDWIGGAPAVADDHLQRFVGRNGHPEAASEAVKGFFTYGLLTGAPLVSITRAPIAPAPVPVKHLIASIAQACNLRCGYCYADFGHYRRDPDMMQLETAKRYVDFLLEQSGGAPRLIYTFFGGEPLLNFPVIRETVIYGRRREAEFGSHIQFGLTTNGTLLNPEMIDFFCAEEIETTISIDGIGEVNDRLRPFAGGAGSFDVLRERMTPLLRRRPTPARVTVTTQNLDIAPMFDALVEMGFAEVGFSPVSSGDPRYALGVADRERFVDGLEALAGKTLRGLEQGRVLGFSNLLQLVRQIHEAERHHHPCGAGMSLLAGNSAGELYACHRLINDSEFAMGDLSGGVDREAQAKHLERLHVDHKTPCQSCWAQGLCGGGCYAVAKNETGEGAAVPWQHCDSIRRWYRAGIEAYLRISLDYPEWIPRIVRATTTQENYETSPV